MISIALFIAAKSQSLILGKWSGVFKPGPISITIQIELKSDNGVLVGTGRSPQMGNETVKLDDLHFEQEKLRFSVKEVGIRFTGTLDHDSDTIIGNISRKSVFPLTLKRGWPAAPTVRTQTPKKPLPYKILDFVLTQPGDRRLSGVTWLPAKSLARTGVVLLCGAGAHDKYCSVFDHKMFEVLGDHIVRAGFVCASFDSRGIGESTGVFADATLTELADDALAVGNYLRTNASCEKIVYIGHSQGANVAALASQADPNCDGVVLLAPVAVSTNQILSKKDPNLAKRVRLLLELDQVQRQAVLSSDTSLDAELLRSLFAERSSIDSLQFDLRKHLGATSTLAISGGLDLEYEGSGNHEALLKTSNVQSELISNLNHLLQPSKKGQEMNYRDNPITIDSRVLRSVLKFLAQRERSNIRSGSRFSGRNGA